MYLPTLSNDELIRLAQPATELEREALLRLDKAETDLSDGRLKILDDQGVDAAELQSLLDAVIDDVPNTVLLLGALVAGEVDSPDRLAEILEYKEFAMQYDSPDDLQDRLDLADRYEAQQARKDRRKARS